MTPLSQLNPWEREALQYNYPDDPPSSDESEEYLQRRRNNSAADPVMYPGLYCPSGIDMMSILLRVISRPDPQVNLGPIDCSVALVLCDLSQADAPIVYVSDSFCELTGYDRLEVMGRNCRFLQGPGGAVRKSAARPDVKPETLMAMGRSIEHNEEIQIEVLNYKKDGRRFTNLLTMIPVRWDGQEFKYSVGFQCETED